MSRKPHVLVVEDNEAVTSALRVLYEAEDCRVSVAGTIERALDIAELDPAKLVLLDVSLPDGDGLLLVEALLVAGCKTVVALTGYDDEDTRLRCIDSGCVDVLVKPVPIKDLMEKSAMWLR